MVFQRIKVKSKTVLSRNGLKAMYLNSKIITDNLILLSQYKAGQDNILSILSTIGFDLFVIKQYQQLLPIQSLPLSESKKRQLYDTLILIKGMHENPIVIELIENWLQLSEDYIFVDDHSTSNKQYSLSDAHIFINTIWFESFPKGNVSFRSINSLKSLSTKDKVLLAKRIDRMRQLLNDITVNNIFPNSYYHTSMMLAKLIDIMQELLSSEDYLRWICQITTESHSDLIDSKWNFIFKKLKNTSSLVENPHRNHLQLVLNIAQRFIPQTGYNISNNKCRDMTLLSDTINILLQQVKQRYIHNQRAVARTQRLESYVFQRCLELLPSNNLAINPNSVFLGTLFIAKVFLSLNVPIPKILKIIPEKYHQNTINAIWIVKFQLPETIESQQQLSTYKTEDLLIWLSRPPDKISIVDIVKSNIGYEQIAAILRQKSLNNLLKETRKIPENNSTLSIPEKLIMWRCLWELKARYHDNTDMQNQIDSYFTWLDYKPDYLQKLTKESAEKILSNHNNIETVAAAEKILLGAETLLNRKTGTYGYSDFGNYGQHIFEKKLSEDVELQTYVQHRLLYLLLHPSVQTQWFALQQIHNFIFDINSALPILFSFAHEQSNKHVISETLNILWEFLSNKYKHWDLSRDQIDSIFYVIEMQKIDGYLIADIPRKLTNKLANNKPLLMHYYSRVLELMTKDINTWSPFMIVFTIQSLSALIETNPKVVSATAKITLSSFFENIPYDIFKKHNINIYNALMKLDHYSETHLKLLVQVLKDDYYINNQDTYFYNQRIKDIKALVNNLSQHQLKSLDALILVKDAHSSSPITDFLMQVKNTATNNISNKKSDLAIKPSSSNETNIKEEILSTIPMIKRLASIFPGLLAAIFCVFLGFFTYYYKYEEISNTSTTNILATDENDKKKNVNIKAVTIHRNGTLFDLPILPASIRDDTAEYTDQGEAIENLVTVGKVTLSLGLKQIHPSSIFMFKTKVYGETNKNGVFDKAINHFEDRIILDDDAYMILACPISNTNNSLLFPLPIFSEGALNKDNISFLNQNGNRVNPDYSIIGGIIAPMIMIKEPFTGKIIYQSKFISGYKKHEKEALPIYFFEEYLQTPPNPIIYPNKLAEIKKIPLNATPFNQINTLNNIFQKYVVYGTTSGSGVNNIKGYFVNHWLNNLEWDCGVSNSTALVIVRKKFKIPGRLIGGHIGQCDTQGNLTLSLTPHAISQFWYNSKFHDHDFTPLNKNPNVYVTEYAGGPGLTDTNNKQNSYSNSQNKSPQVENKGTDLTKIPTRSSPNEDKSNSAVNNKPFRREDSISKQLRELYRLNNYRNLQQLFGITDIGLP